MNQEKRYDYLNKGLYILCFLAVLLADMFVSYSSGDDRIHLQLANNMNLVQFVPAVGARVTSNITLFYVLKFPIVIWKILNAVIFCVLYHVVVRLVELEGTVNDSKNRFCTRFVLLISFVFVHVSSLGYSVFWISGSQVYLWPLALGLLSILFEIKYVAGGKFYDFFLCVLFALYGGMGQEQVSVFLIVASFCIAYRNKVKRNRINTGCLFVIWGVRIFCFLVLLFSTGTQARMAVTSFYTNFNSLTLLQHLFLTVQWELSAFANELKILFVFIWILLMIVWWGKRRSGILAVMVAAALPAFAGFDFFSNLGITTLTDMGMKVEDIVRLTDNTVSFDTLTIGNWVNFVWWFVCVFIITPYFLKENSTCLVLYLAAMCLPLMLIVSPGMYVSGGRTFWTSSVLLSILIGILLSRKKLKVNYLYILAGAVCLGVYELVVDLDYLFRHWKF